MKWLQDYLATTRKRGETAAERADRETIERSIRKGEIDDFRRDCLTELQQERLSPQRREAIHAMLSESYRAEGYRDDVVFNGSCFATLSRKE